MSGTHPTDDRRAAAGAPPGGGPPGGDPAGGAGPHPAQDLAFFRDQGDEDLVRLAQAGDTRAFDELVRRYQDKVYRLSYKILRHEDDAAEALQDAFLSAYRGLRNFKVESTFSTWLYRIATNASLMKYRKRRDHHISLEQSQSANEDAETLQLPDWSTQPVTDLLNAETREVMQEGIDRLPEELKVVFVHRDLEGMSNTEVAEILDLSVAAVKSRLHRARVILRERLNRYFADKMTKRDRRGKR
ncbi:MAG TPA: sigma-70 family RNA polymerase sigma factor [Candidatus Eisenbacteria bacterium]|nr:sigma-70 family RNA polymerase sigma factor [Candidatus Eisenbacteria bacterium]